MSGGASEAPAGCEAPAGGGKKREWPGSAGSSARLIVKDLGEIHSRLLDHRPVIQGETRYFVKEFEEKRGLRELRVLENLKTMIQETSEHTLPTCGETLEDSLKEVLQRLRAANESARRLLQQEQERRQVYNDHLTASEKQRLLQWEEIVRDQPRQRAAVDDEHARALQRLREQYAEMEKDLAKFTTF
uniref:Biogenesis of lysosome-related organelles complex 1 subunit 5 n=1 Tax=Jaculus jaculus TaxID=51337 RepID=A0A8C5LAF2_JACJA|nr:biogenesis of lysosome-related organelles complex 1 subunit 5 [Jaculus jaculus]